jgi:hypothetical protein
MVGNPSDEGKVNFGDEIFRARGSAALVLVHMGSGPLTCKRRKATRTSAQ